MFFVRLFNLPETYLALLLLGSVLFSFVLKFNSDVLKGIGQNLFGVISGAQMVSVGAVGAVLFLVLLLKKDWQALKRLFAYVAFFVVGSAGTVYLLHWVFTSVSVEKIITTTVYLTELDEKIFGNYLYLLPATPWLEYLFVGAYWLLSTLAILTIVLSALVDRGGLRKFLFSFLLLSVVSVPFWYSFPATSPAGFFRANIFSIRPPAPIQNALAGKPLTPYMQSEMERIRNVWIVPVNGYYNVSTIPSLHAGYGLLIVLFLYGVRKYSAFLTIPWFLLNSIGAVYIEQHFGLDIVAGVVLVSAVYLFTGWLFRRCGVK